jgi:CDP-glycerol glycerophosphotransferase (TagB/SpsB family)
MMMPTHRSWLFGVEPQIFRDSDYYKKYLAYLNAPELGQILEKHDLTLAFIVHPSIAEHTDLFTSSIGRVRIVKPGEEAIDDLMMRSKALITDYSSVAWDMFYMNKPSLFYQFDTEEYDAAWGSYIDLKTEMPGDRAETHEELLALTERYADEGFRLSSRFEGLRARYFKYLDQDNCKRIGEEIRARGL